jgi:hypothetical protein
VVQLCADDKVSLKEVNQYLAQSRLGLQIVDEEGRKVGEKFFRERLAELQRVQQADLQEKTEVERDLGRLDADRVGEQRRMGDVRAKLERALADCDMLIIPRMTVLEEGVSEIPTSIFQLVPPNFPNFYDLDARQALAIKDFLASGKPVLCCWGTANKEGAPADPPDELEKLLAQLGLHFGRRTVLYNVEERVFTAPSDSPFRAGKPLQLPPLDLENPPYNRDEQKLLARMREIQSKLAILGGLSGGPLQSLPFLILPSDEPEKPANRLRQSLHLAEVCIGKDLNLTLRYARPVYLDAAFDPTARKKNPGMAGPDQAEKDLREALKKLPTDPVVLVTSSATWNDAQPFPTRSRRVPRFDSPDTVSEGLPPEEGKKTETDADKDTLEARRHGPFVLGLAYEAPVPRSWLPSASSEGRSVRLAAIGHGGVFVGKELAPAREKLLLDTCNWLLGRQDRLANPDSPEWRYPRVDMDERTRSIWLWATGLGMPVLFAYLGLVVLLARRLR